MLTCSHVRARLSEALDGEIQGPYAKYIWFHTRVCPPCKKVRLSLERTLKLLGQLREFEDVEGESERLG